MLSVSPHVIPGSQRCLVRDVHDRGELLHLSSVSSLPPLFPPSLIFSLAFFFTLQPSLPHFFPRSNFYLPPFFPSFTSSISSFLLPFFPISFLSSQFVPPAFFLLSHLPYLPASNSTSCVFFHPSVFVPCSILFFPSSHSLTRSLTNAISGSLIHSPTLSIFHPSLFPFTPSVHLFLLCVKYPPFLSLLVIHCPYLLPLPIWYTN